MTMTAHARLHSSIRSLGILALGALTAAACVSTENGTTYAGPNIGKAILIEGFHTAPNTHVAIQVLSSPTSDPNNDASWTTVATTFSSSTVSLTWNNETDLFAWTVNAVLVPNAAAAARWPEGGLVKVRAKLDNSVIMSPTIDDKDCMLEQNDLGTPFLDAVAICESHDSRVLTLVDIDNLPNPATDFLSRRQNSLAQATEYYKAVGALTAGGAPSASRGTFSAWKATNGFPTGEIVATYYNRGDLGFGRDMHCRTTGFGKACYVTNYGTVEDGLDDLADGTALNDAIAHANPGATVAMEWHQAAAANQNPVRFFVYDPAGAIDRDVALDSNPAEQAVPGLCLACHGGTFRTDGTVRVENAQFLPFDVDSFAYHEDLTKEDQLDEFAALNNLVKATVPVGSTTRELIDGWHAAPGVFNGDFVPAGWQGSKEREALYKYVYRPFCQMCHTARTADSFVPKTFANFSTQKARITDVTCGAPAAISMPHAEVTYELFWRSSARAHLMGTLGIRDACDGK